MNCNFECVRRIYERQKQESQDFLIITEEHENFMRNPSKLDFDDDDEEMPQIVEEKDDRKESRSTEKYLSVNS